jgi:cell division transport system ATP-binding protein
MVRFENVGMRYGAGPEVLRDVTFTLEPGSLTFLTGPSGAGKSSLLKLVFMTQKPSRGLISLFGRDLARLKRDVEELLSWVGLGTRMQAKPPTLSGGEQQRVAIARAVVAKPDLLLADEPTGNVDPDMGERLIRLFVELNRFGTTVMIATHDRALVESTPGREMRLVDGRVIEMRSNR